VRQQVGLSSAGVAGRTRLGVTNSADPAIRVWG
jgi:hypothetical protein